MNQRDSRRPSSNLTRRLAASLLLLSSISVPAGAAPTGAAPCCVETIQTTFPAAGAAKKTESAESITGTTDKMPNPGLWGGTGLLTVPTADILPSHNFYGALSYFPLNSGLSLTGTVSIFDDLEAGLVFGVPPAAGFSALAASLKYRIMNQAKGQPVSLALGASLLGLGDTPSYVPGSNVYLMISRGFDWEQTRIVNLHGGFMGGLGGARGVAGLDVPILDFARVELEYLGNLNNLSHTVNLGVVITPTPNLNIQAGLMQRPGSFWDRDFVLSVGWRGNWGEWFGISNDPGPKPSSRPGTAPSATPSTEPSAEPVVKRLPAQEKGSARIRAIDAERIIALDKATVSLSQPETELRFNAKTDISGEVSFERIPIGTYNVVVEKDGWVLEQRKISVQQDLETFLEVPLSGKGGTIYGQIEAAGGGPTGDLDVEVQDASHLVIRRVNLTGASYRIDKLPPGTYLLLVKSNGSERLRLNILVRANQESQYDLTLPPSGDIPPNPSAMPSAMPSAVPSGAPSASPSAAPTPPPSTVPTSTPGPVSAQLEGVVKDKEGKLMPGVRMELKNDDLLVITLTNGEGRYTFRDIPQGIFRLQLSKDGFKGRAFQITIVKSEVMKNDFQLEPGQ